MKCYYDLHIHSALSPCADDDMSPISICTVANLNGLNMIAIADHNSIANVEAAIEIGNLLNVTVIPAMELQTSEDIHVLCLFEEYASLKNFYQEIKFTELKNEPEIFGRQLVINCDDEIVEEVQQLLLTAADISLDHIPALIKKHHGIAIPAHIDREANGILAILGTVEKDMGFHILEFSNYAKAELIEKYSDYIRIIDSDSHKLETISKAVNYLELEECTAAGLLKKLRVES